MGEAQTGNAPGGGTTATAVAVASQDSMTRMERMVEQWRRYLESIALKVAFYIGTSKEVEIVLDTDALDELGPPTEEELVGALAAAYPETEPGMWTERQVQAVLSQARPYRGGALSPEAFELIKVVIDVVSVQRTSEERVQARLLQGTQMLMGAIPSVMQVPSKDFWHTLFALVGNTLQVPDLGELGDKLVEGVLAVLQQDLPSLATAPQGEQTPGVSVSNGGGAPRSQQAAAPQYGQQSMRQPEPQQQQNRTPGLSNGVPQPAPLAGVGGTSGRQ